MLAIPNSTIVTLVQISLAVVLLSVTSFLFGTPYISQPRAGAVKRFANFCWASRPPIIMLSDAVTVIQYIVQCSRLGSTAT